MTCSGAASPRRQAAVSRRLVKFTRASTTPGRLQQGAFDPRDAAPAGDAFDGKLHFDRAVGARTREQ